ncbi:MAG: DUF1360 domain-containing protein [Actinomycetota bacterium]|nr:DUF1360 domain-containing protein [Actinomycetota bacterium]
MNRKYDPAGEVNLGGFAGSMTAYAAFVAGIGSVMKARDLELPEAYRIVDLVLGGVATHKLSRLIAKGSIVSPIRAPFTEFVQATGSSEHDEDPRSDNGLRHTMGELLTCPFCLGVWIATAYVAGLVVAPRPTRAAGAILSVAAISDALQQAYSRLRTD